MDPRPDRALPRSFCWLGLRARGMNMKDLSAAGYIYLGSQAGKDIRTGLSRRSGGR